MIRALLKGASRVLVLAPPRRRRMLDEPTPEGRDLVHRVLADARARNNLRIEISSTDGGPVVNEERYGQTMPRIHWMSFYAILFLTITSTVVLAAVVSPILAGLTAGGGCTLSAMNAALGTRRAFEGWK